MQSCVAAVYRRGSNVADRRQSLQVIRGGERSHPGRDRHSYQGAFQLNEPAGDGRAGTDADASFANVIRGIFIDYNCHHHDGDYQIAPGAKFQKY
jgi:hypothetical protein